MFLVKYWWGEKSLELAGDATKELKVLRSLVWTCRYCKRFGISEAQKDFNFILVQMVVDMMQFLFMMEEVAIRVVTSFEIQEVAEDDDRFQTRLNGMDVFVLGFQYS